MESPLSISLVVAITVAVFLPYGTHAMVTVLFVGMVIRSMNCSLEGGSPLVNMALLVPAWPAYVAVDSIRRWMKRVGFGPAFRVSVTGVLFALCWLPFLGTGDMIHASAVIIGAAATAVLREYVRGQWYLVPSLGLTLIYARMWT